LVLTAVRQNIRLIGNRIDSAKIGTLANVYTPQNSLAIEASRDIKKYCMMGLQVKPHFAKSFNVNVNYKIAETFNLKGIDEHNLTKKIATMEQKNLRDNEKTIHKVVQGKK